MTESYHFQIEPEPAKEALFRVGGVYRQNDQTVVRIVPINCELHLAMWEETFPGRPVAAAETIFDGYGKGYVCLDNGWYVQASADYHPQNLVPGELICRSGEWITAEAPATIGPFGSGASLKTDGSQITGRIEPEAIAAANLAKQIDNEVMENLRAPLPHFNQRTEFDPFPGFKVRSDTGWMTGEDGHPLQRMTADSPTHGSAHLLAKP